MTKNPPLLPEETLRRVTRVARFDGWSVVVVAGTFAIVSALLRDATGAAVGAIVAGAGVIELRGVARLRARDPRAMRWLIASQLYLLTAILGYALWRFGHPDPLLLRATQAMMTGEQKLELQQVGFSETEFVRMVCRLVYLCLGLVTVLYQGGMTLYYVRHRTSVLNALTSAPSE